MDTINNEKVEIRVKDNGRGISSENVEQIFNSFFTTKEAGKGTDLGLALCDRLVKEMKGEIWLSSNLGEGTTFFIQIPLVDKETTEKEAIEKETHRIIESEEFVMALNPSKTKILIVDDEEDIRNLLSEELEEYGFEVTRSENAIDAIEKLKDNTFDFEISDMKMPEMNGEEMTAIAKFEMGVASKFIILSGGVQQQSNPLLEYGDLSADAYLEKPYDIDVVMETLFQLALKDQVETKSA